MTTARFTREQQSLVNLIWAIISLVCGIAFVICAVYVQIKSPSFNLATLYLGAIALGCFVCAIAWIREQHKVALRRNERDSR
jgi:high-affinity Fe2+/Pb2+ permease